MDITKFYLYGDPGLSYVISLQDIRRRFEKFIQFAERVNQLLDFRFVLDEAPKYEIQEISFEDPDFYGHPDWEEECSWKDGAYAKTCRPMDSKHYILYLNPKINKDEAAKYLSKRTGLKIKSYEVLYFTWFHECAHTRKVSGPHSPERLFARAFFLGKKYPGDSSITTRETLHDLRTRAEKEADEWAIKQFRKWRRNRGRIRKETLPLSGPLALLEE